MASYQDADLRRLEARLLRNGYKTAEKLWLRSQRKAFQGFDTLLFDFYTTHNRLPRFLEWVLRREIRSISDPMELMRRSSESLAANVLHGILFSPAGRAFLADALTDFVENVIDIRPFNYITILHECKSLIDSLTAKAPECPATVKAAFSILKSTVLKYHPEVTSFIPAVFFLHFICPALMQPATYGLVDTRPDTESLGNLIIGCKILQCMANSSVEQATATVAQGEAGKILKRLVETSQPKIATFMAEICDGNASNLDSTESEDSSSLQQRKEETLKALGDFCYRHKISRILLQQIPARPEPPSTTTLVPDAQGRIALTTLLRTRPKSPVKRRGSDSNGGNLSTSPGSSRRSTSSRERASPLRPRKTSDVSRTLEESPADLEPRGPAKRSLGAYSSNDDSYLDDSRSEDRSEEGSQRGEDDAEDDLDIEDLRRHDDIIEEDDTAAVTIPPMTLKRVVRSTDGSMIALEDLLGQSKLTLVVLLRHFG
eukprot:TRINITY_DN2796_c0_g1_i2.p1 TRINITY_DN2796_c0_g1~~TRINITY_DN2796_c0_g1_i2.p1  ORF type:complete len:487 (+),score=83.88 TRINITY_DN2796_c0_g1_i2:103-1563(+)